MHISFSEEIKTKLKIFSKNRRKSMSAVIKEALEDKFTREDQDPKKEAALKEALQRRFHIPSGFDTKACISTIYLLANRYPNKSAKDFWTDMIYLSPEDLTHREVLSRIVKDRDSLLEENGTA